ncbi:MAG TPA: DinB family protein [Acidobacteriota bacterium]|nr:DinB family protein [Acidobacteriota bacterium]
MESVEHIRRLWKHAFWADRLMLEALQAAFQPPERALREWAHVLGAQEIWLSRLQGRSSRAAVWPEVSLQEAEELMGQTQQSLAAYLDGLSDRLLEQTIEYVNSAGQSFSSSVGDILVHTALHGHYHRGKVNLILRQSGHDPAPCDFIACARGVPAATEASARGAKKRQS